jgi:CheY-like chemotaxis protein
VVLYFGSGFITELLIRMLYRYLLDGHFFLNLRRQKKYFLLSKEKNMGNKKFKAVMLIDDNEIDNLINQKMIEAADMAETIFMHTGAKGALEFLRNMEKLSANGVGIPEVIFLDIDMPLMDGFQFLDEFEKLSDYIKNNCTIIMLTSSINPQDLSKAKKSSFVKKYINKPLTQEALEKL